MTTSPVLVPESQRGAVARSAVYRWLSTLFVFPGDEISGVSHAAAKVVAMRELIADLPYPAETIALLTQQLQALANWTGQEAAQERLATTYTSLFDNCRGRAAVSLYEKDYGNGDAKMVWEEVIRFYEHFGLSFDVRHQKDWPDNIGTELEFMHYLSYLEATALDADRPLYVQAQGDFLIRRLARWAGRFARQVRGAVQHAPYGDYADLVVAIVDAEMTFLGRERETLSPWVPMNEAGTGGAGKHWLPIVQQTDAVPDWEMEEPFR